MHAWPLRDTPESKVSGDHQVHDAAGASPLHFADSQQEKRVWFWFISHMHSVGFPDFLSVLMLCMVCVTWKHTEQSAGAVPVWEVWLCPCITQGVKADMSVWMKVMHQEEPASALPVVWHSSGSGAYRLWGPLHGSWGAPWLFYSPHHGWARGTGRQSPNADLRHGFPPSWGEGFGGWARREPRDLHVCLPAGMAPLPWPGQTHHGS